MINKIFLLSLGFSSSLIVFWLAMNPSFLSIEPSNSTANGISKTSTNRMANSLSAEKGHTNHPSVSDRNKKELAAAKSAQPVSMSTFSANASARFSPGTPIRLKIPKSTVKKIRGYEKSDRLDSGILQATDSSKFVVVTPEGKMLTIPGSLSKVASPLPSSFSRYNSDQMKRYLIKQYGKNFHILRSRFFVLAISKNITNSRAKFWAKKMDGFHRSLEAYFNIRNIPLKPSKNTLVAMVFSSRAEMTQYAKSVGDRILPSYLAYYSSTTNRIALYDSPQEKLDLETVYHESAHQILYNRGFHYRSVPAPRWLVEGIASAFEAPGLYDHRHQTKRSDRVPPNHLRRIQSLVKDSSARSKITQLLRSDDLFKTNISEAYTIGWAITFYCLENHPVRFAKYVKEVNQKKPFTRPNPNQRRSLFERAMDDSAENFADQLIRYYRTSKNFQ